MHTRIGLLTVLLASVLGAGVAAQAPSAEATPSYAPADIGGAVPDRIGSLDLYVRAIRVSDDGLASDPDDRSYWLDWLTARGRRAADMVVAYGVDSASPADPALELWALRVPGIAGDELIEPTLVTSEGSDLSEVAPGGHADWRDLEGRRVLVLTADAADGWRAYYPLGEVLFIAHGDGRATVEEVIAALGNEVAAQGASPPPWFGGRVEMPEHGFAVTLPDDWVGFDTAADHGSQIEAASGVVDPVVWSQDGVDALPPSLASAASSGFRLWAIDADRVDWCSVSAFREPPWSPLELADYLLGLLGDDPAADDIEPVQQTDLPAGLAQVVRWSHAGEPNTGYLLGTEEILLMVGCTSRDARREDDWLSVAETIELLPADEE